MPTYTGTDADYPEIPNFVPLQTEPDVRPKTHRHPDHGPFRRAELPDRKLQPLHDRSPGFLRAPIKAQNASAVPVPAEGPLNATVVTRGPPRSRALLSRDGWNPWGAAHLKDYIGSGYLMEFYIGNLPQNTSLLIDTGSYEMWTTPTCANSAATAYCKSLGLYDPSKSLTAHRINGYYNVTYGSGTVNASYYIDQMTFANEQLFPVKFAVATQTTHAWSGLVGLGYGFPYTIDYKNIVDLLVQGNWINGPVFSIDVGSQDVDNGEIIFGGINQYHFYGNLTPVEIWPPIAEQDPAWLQYFVNVTSVGVTPQGKPSQLFTDRNNFSMPVLIDTGSTLSYFRTDLVQLIAQQLNAAMDQFGNLVLDCNWAKTTTSTVDFGFNRGQDKVIISIAVRDFIYEQVPGWCIMGAQPAQPGASAYVLGDAFIRGAYLTFDQKEDIVWMAPYWKCGDAITAVPENLKDAMPIRGMC